MSAMPPATTKPHPELVQAMIDNYRRERARPGDRLQVSFFGGPPPLTTSSNPVRISLLWFVYGRIF